MGSRLRVGRAIGKAEEVIAPELMDQVKKHRPDEKPPALATDGKGAYRETMLRTWGKVPEYRGRGKPPTRPKPDKCRYAPFCPSENRLLAGSLTVCLPRSGLW